MDFYKVIESRTSNKTYKSTPIPTEKLDKIINAALMAPSWKNRTCYQFIFINEQNLKEQISNAIINRTDQTANAVKQAPIIAVIVADPSESGNIGDKAYFMIDCGIAMEHLVLAATNEGLGTCWIGSFNEEGT
jgi:nitroreductase